MHHDADHETASGAAGQVQQGALLHAQVLLQTALGEKVGGQLDGAAEAGADHGGADAAVQAAHALGLEDLAEAVPGVAVAVLGADGQKGREALQAGLDEEEGRAGGGAHDARGGAAEHVDAQALGLAVLEDERGEGLAHGLVEAEAAAVEQDLVDVGAADAAVDAAQALVAHDDGDAVEGTAVVVRLVALGLELALQLHADLDRLEGVGGRHGAAGGDAASDEGAAEEDMSARMLGHWASFALCFFSPGMRKGGIGYAHGREGARAARGNLPSCCRHGVLWGVVVAVAAAAAVGPFEDSSLELPGSALQRWMRRAEGRGEKRGGGCPGGSAVSFRGTCTRGDRSDSKRPTRTKQEETRRKKEKKNEGERMARAGSARVRRPMAVRGAAYIREQR